MTTKQLKFTNVAIDESVLQKKHYMLSDYTTEHGQVYVVNINNNTAYPLIGKRNGETVALTRKELVK